MVSNNKQSITNSPSILVSLLPITLPTDEQEMIDTDVIFRRTFPRRTAAHADEGPSRTKNHRKHLINILESALAVVEQEEDEP
jgi:hypothetical protein